MFFKHLPHLPLCLRKLRAFFVLFVFFSCGNIELHCSNFLSEESNIRIPVLQDHNQHVAQIAAFKRYVYHLCPLTTQSLYQKTMALIYH